MAGKAGRSGDITKEERAERELLRHPLRIMIEEGRNERWSKPTERSPHGRRYVMLDLVCPECGATGTRHASYWRRSLLVCDGVRVSTAPRVWAEREASTLPVRTPDGRVRVLRAEYGKALGRVESLRAELAYAEGLLDRLGEQLRMMEEG
jgi:hypothetical protein